MILSTKLWGALSLKYDKEKNYTKYEYYELIYLKTTLVFLIASSVIYFAQNLLLGEKSIFVDPTQRIRLILSLISCVLVFGFHHFRHILFNKFLLENPLVYCLEKILSLYIMSAIVIYSGIGPWFYLGFLLPVVTATYIKGGKCGCKVLLFSFAGHMLLYYLKNKADIRAEGIRPTEDLLLAVACYVLFCIAILFFSKLYKCRIEEEISNKVKVEHYEERCMKLEQASEDIKQKYDRLFSNSGKLEESNKVLSKSIAEFYTLNHISQAIGSILDIKELLKRLNDIILGVMGVSFSTIILYDENSNRLKVHTTNVSNINELATITDNINSGVLMDALNKGESILENNVDYFQYIFTCGRNINSLMCIPLTTSSRKFGLILVEHTFSNAFDEDNVRFLNIIAQQVGIVMENAELYYQMKEVARRDGLTGIYNRQYFQECLENEFKEAKKNNYPLSLAIFDVDYFKKFNDTYGHMFGDKVLMSTVDVVKAELRKNDMIARFGGEEFIILLPRTNLADALEKVESLRKKISENVIEDNLISASVTASFGISSFDECAFNENDLVKTADNALYDAKAAGRNCVMVAKKLYEY